MADWVTETAGLIDKTVTNIRNVTVAPAHRFTRYAVYGVMLAAVAVAALVLLVFLTFRGLVLLANLLPAPHDNAWLAWAVMGGIFCVAGAVVWSKRQSPTS